MNVLGSIAALSGLVWFMIYEAKKRILPAKWTDGQSEVWALGLAILICVFLPSFSFLADIIGEDVFALSLGQRIAMAVFIMLGSGWISNGVEKLKK